MGKHKMKIIVLFSAIFILFSLSYYAIVHVAPYSIIKPYRSINRELTSYLGTNYKKLEITTRDSVRLVGYFIKAKTTISKGTVIILHGIGANKESQIGIAEYLSSNGFNSIIFDLRAQGESGGNYCTYGYYEKYDVSDFIDGVNKEIPDSGPIGIMGTSLGGAIAIQAMAYDDRIKCGVVVSTFSSLNEVVYEYMKSILHMPFKFVSDLALTEAGEIAKFPTEKINPIDFACKIEQPILVIHGSKDDRININNGKSIYAKIKSAEKSFYEVKNAMHNDISMVGGIQYLSEILKFFNQKLIS